LRDRNMIVESVSHWKNRDFRILGNPIMFSQHAWVHRGSVFEPNIYIHIKPSDATPISPLCKAHSICLSQSKAVGGGVTMAASLWPIMNHR